MKDKIRVLGMVLSLLLCLPTVVRGESVVHDFAGLKAAVEAAPVGVETRIQVQGEIVFPSGLEIGDRNINLDTSSGAVFKRTFGQSPRYADAYTTFNTPMITVGAGGQLTLNAGLTMDAENKPIEAGDARFIHTLGRLILNGGTYKNSFLHHENLNHNAMGPITALGKNAYIEFNDGLVENNDWCGSEGIGKGERVAHASGAFYLYSVSRRPNALFGYEYGGEGARMVMNGGVIRKNKASVYELQRGVWWSGSGGAGAIFVSPGASLTVNGGRITETISSSPILLGHPNVYFYHDARKTENEAELKARVRQEFGTDTMTPARLLLHGGEIVGNKGLYGGGIGAFGAYDIEMPADSTARIANNVAWQGGGVLLYDFQVLGATDVNNPFGDHQRAKVSSEIWEKYIPTRFHMSGGSIQENTSNLIGGGILVSAQGTVVDGGKILNNLARYYGGGIAISAQPYVLRVEDALLTGNSAYWDGSAVMAYGIPLPSGSGGNLWSCPTGNFTFHLNQGIAMVESKARRHGDDFYNAAKRRDHVDDLAFLAPRLPSGAKVKYYKDMGPNRYVPGQGVLLNPREIAAGEAGKAVVEDSAKQIEISRKLAKLIIEGNRAPRGGGIGSNGSVIGGRKPTPDQPSKRIEIQKIWADGTTPGDITVEVRGHIGDQDWLIESFVLNEGNHYRQVLEDLPNLIHGQPLEKVLYLKELGSDYKVEIGEWTDVPTEAEPGRLQFDLWRDFTRRRNESVLSAYGKTKAFDQEENRWNDFSVNYKLHVEGSEKVYTQTITYLKDNYSVDHPYVTYAEIPFAGKSVEVRYTLENGDFYSPGLFDYDLYLKPETADKWVLEVPKLRATFGAEAQAAPTDDVRIIDIDKLRVKEGKVPDDLKSYRIRITNETVRMDVEKKWEGGENTTHPEIQVQVLANGQAVPGKILTLNAANGYKASFDCVPYQDARGQVIHYSVQEVGENGGEISLEGKTYKVSYREEQGKWVIVNRSRELPPPTPPVPTPPTPAPPPTPTPPPPHKPPKDKVPQTGACR